MFAFFAFLKHVWVSASPQTRQQWIGALGTLLTAIITAALTTSLLLPVPVPVPPPGPDIAVPPWTDQFGWVSDPEAVASVAAELEFRSFSDTPAGRVVKDDPTAVYLWQAYGKIGKTATIKNQGQVGSCVSFGTNSAIMRTLTVSLALKKQNGEWKEIVEEVTYGGSRVQVGGGKIRGDGSVGAWAAQFVQRWGVVAREKVGGVDLSAYDQSRCRKYGDPPGPPPAVLDACKLSPVKNITLVKSWSEAKKALASGYAIAVCSNQGFAMQRDANGVCAASGSWAHCMCLDGYHQEGTSEYGHITNSWGPDAHKGPVGWGNPGTDGFWAKASVVESMLRQGDSWAFSDAVGFPAREIDWFVHFVPKKGLHHDPNLFGALAPGGLFAVGCSAIR